MRRLGALNDDMGQSVVAYLQHCQPDFRPARILDMGCTVGHSTLPYADAYPAAELCAIDVGAPVLRYAHARAEALGKAVHFSQQNAEITSFADASFDLIVSHILLHETSSRALRNIVRESYRLLAPGGLMIHQEVPQYHGLDPYQAFVLDWDTYNNNEPFWGTLRDSDLTAIAREAGFAKERVLETMIPSAAQVKARTGRFQAGDFGGSGHWFLFAATK